MNTAPLQQPLFDLNTAPPRLVPYDVPAQKDWNGIVLVGEAPGAEEAKQGHPFVGRSGKLLNDVLTEAGLDRAACLVANVFRFQPPGNKVDHFFLSQRAATAQGVPLATAYGRFGSAWCRGDFASEIEALRDVLTQWQPRVIVALGRTPFWALTGENGLLNAVGQVFDCRLCAGLPVIPTYHPSFILRGNWGLQPTWISHLLAAKQQAAKKTAAK